MDKLKPLFIVGGIVKWHLHILKMVWKFLKKMNKELPYDPAITCRNRSTRDEIHVHTKTYMHMFKPAFLAIAKAETTQMSIIG